MWAQRVAARACGGELRDVGVGQIDCGVLEPRLVATGRYAEGNGRYALYVLQLAVEYQHLRAVVLAGRPRHLVAGHSEVGEVAYGVGTLVVVERHNVVNNLAAGVEPRAVGLVAGSGEGVGDANAQRVAGSGAHHQALVVSLLGAAVYRDDIVGVAVVVISELAVVAIPADDNLAALCWVGRDGDVGGSLEVAVGNHEHVAHHEVGLSMAAARRHLEGWVEAAAAVIAQRHEHLGAGRLPHADALHGREGGGVGWVGHHADDDGGGVFGADFGDQVLEVHQLGREVDDPLVHGAVDGVEHRHHGVVVAGGVGLELQGVNYILFVGKLRHGRIAFVGDARPAVGHFSLFDIFEIERRGHLIEYLAVGEAWAEAAAGAEGLGRTCHVAGVAFAAYRPHVGLIFCHRCQPFQLVGRCGGHFCVPIIVARLVVIHQIALGSNILPSQCCECLLCNCHLSDLYRQC